MSVATLWRSPTSPRSVDRPALENPARIREWLAGLTVEGRRGLNGRADTQALLADRVIVTALAGSWAKIAVPDQPTPLDARGYPGWVPLAQLTARPPAASSATATVVSTTAWLRSDDDLSRATLEVSFGTRLPIVSSSATTVRVALPDGRVLQVASAHVAIARPEAPALAASGADVVRAATMFTGLPYLWAGRSGFGLDCSGLTSLDYRVHGITIPRDAGPQSTTGQPARSAALRPGDLLFYAAGGEVHHVAMYAGGGQLIHSPSTGRTVETIAVASAPFAREFSGARRYLP